MVMTPPTVSIPRVRGVISRRMMSLRVSSSLLERIPPWMAAPAATASSGLTPELGSFPLKNPFNNSLTLGIRVEPPTRTTSLIWFFFNLASC